MALVLWHIMKCNNGAHSFQQRARVSVAVRNVVSPQVKFSLGCRLCTGSEVLCPDFALKLARKHTDYKQPEYVWIWQIVSCWFDPEPSRLRSYL